MPPQRATFKVLVGPNAGDALRIEPGSCRLLGRHLSENETAFIDRDGNRVLDASAADMLTEHLKKHKKGRRSAPARLAAGRPQPPAKPAKPEPGRAVNLDAFERGPDIILSDDAISRAHAMLFCDESGVGIIDLASTNGTYVNGERISSAMVQDGDVVAIGSSEVAVSWRLR